MQAAPVLLSSFILAFCGLTYEFVFAQSLSVILGNSVVQYSTTIGLFLAALGFGAMFTKVDQHAHSRLRRLQLCLSLLAPLGFFLMWLVAVFLPPIVARVVAYALIVGIGYLTGSELPLLFQMGGSPLRLKILAADYFGMLLACVLFPLVLLPNYGVFVSVLMAGLFNTAVLLMLCSSVYERVVSLTVAALLIALLYMQPAIQEWLSQNFT